MQTILFAKFIISFYKFLCFQTKFYELKVLLGKECKLSDYILDHFVDDGESKKVKIGLADEEQGAIVLRCLNGYNFGGNILSVRPVGKDPVRNITVLIVFTKFFKISFYLLEISKTETTINLQ